MIVSETLTIDVGDATMPAYLARPAADGPHPAVIVLEGVYGFDDELKRITDLLASCGYVGLAINYFYRTNPTLSEPFSPDGRAHGEEAAKAVLKAQACTDVGAARDYLNDRTFVERGRIGSWGFGFGGTVAFVTATLPGINAAVVFYGQSIASLMPSGEHAPLEEAKDIRSPLLLVFGGQDELVSQGDVDTITRTLSSADKRFDVQMYPNVGHSFFRAAAGTNSMREAADAWDRVQAFFRKNLQ
ncbi:MAG: dienelactone hydrolase family protein [Candidatus Eremiobacteraeota bacterium]|nr:dienelactone hydrolase family protein [Candidatus Eremiobacteraeota bacterium]